MDIQLMRTFLTVAKLSNMTQAAEQLNFTQPTITGQIRTLEQHFGVMLFERVGKKLYITAAGQKLIDYAEKIVTALNEAEEALSADLGSVNLGFASAMVNYFLLPVLKEYQDNGAPGPITVEMCANTMTVVKGIMENRFDLGFALHHADENCLIQFEIFKEQLVWVAHHKLLEKHNNSNNILDYPILAYKSGGLFSELCRKTMMGPKIASTIEYTDSEVLKKAVLDGLGVGALPLVMIKPLLDGGTLIEYAGMPRMDFSVWLVIHKDKILTRAAKEFLKILRENMLVADEFRTRPLP